MINSSLLSEEERLPLVITPATRGVDLVGWASNHVEFIENNLLQSGAILFRDFDVKATSEFQRLIRAISGDLLKYQERSSPRSEVADRIYTSTDYPPEHRIFLHNENSYQQVWPLRIFFYCAVAPDRGGETPIASCRQVLARIDPKIVERFARKRVLYVRNFGDGLGLPWRTVFQTDDKRDVEERCRRLGIKVEWKDNDGLRTLAVRDALRRHPRTGDTIWFNHATFFHISTLEKGIREMLLSELDEEDLPTNSYYGDGTRIEADVLAELREAYEHATVKFPWQRGSVLMLDNMLTAHGRDAYTGPRKILVGMANPISAI